MKRKLLKKLNVSKATVSNLNSVKAGTGEPETGAMPGSFPNGTSCDWHTNCQTCSCSACRC